MRHVRHEALRIWVGAVLARLGLELNDADIAAEAIVRTSLRGVDTHGVALLPHYVRLLRSGDAKARPKLTVQERGLVHVVEADCGLGQVVGTRVMARLCDRARSGGMAAATLHDVGHLGALGHFALEAAEAGCLALVMQNAQPLMGLPGATGRLIGNNPLALGAPLRGRDPLVFDMATSEAALGKIMEAARTGTRLPPGWALDADGRPTDDPGAGLAGMLMPSAGSKGIGLAMLVEVLAGSLSGSRPALLTREGQIPHGFGAFMLVIDPDIVAGRDAFDAHMTAWLDHYLARAETPRYPGLRAAETERGRRQAGIPVDAGLESSLAEIGQLLDRPFPIG